MLIVVPSTPSSTRIYYYYTLLLLLLLLLLRRLHVPVVREGGKMEGRPSLPVSYSYVHLGIDENPSYVTMSVLTGGREEVQCEGC